jgi:hypothetical protein
VTDDVTEDSPTHTAHEPADSTNAVAGDERAPQYGVGPFSVREVALVAVWALAFIVSFFSLSTLRFDSVWTAGLLWILTIAVPSVAVFLLVLRRLSPDGIRRVGSLGIDQFASVAFTVSAVLWLQLVWETVSFVVQDGPWVRSWVMWVEFFLMLAGVVLTVFAPVLPVICEDFQDRREIPAHRSARPVRPVVARPKPEPRPEPEPVAEEQASSPYGDPYATGPLGGQDAGTPAHTGGYDTGGYDTGSFDPDQTVTSARDATAAVAWAPEASGTGRTESYDTASREQAPAASHPVAQQPFWALAATERDVYDAQGSPLFRIGPTAWALVIEDRGSVFVVRHEDGRIGYLHDVSGVTRG